MIIPPGVWNNIICTMKMEPSLIPCYRANVKFISTEMIHPVPVIFLWDGTVSYPTYLVYVVHVQHSLFIWTLNNTKTDIKYGVQWNVKLFFHFSISIRLFLHNFFSFQLFLLHFPILNFILHKHLLLVSVPSTSSFSSSSVS